MNEPGGQDAGAPQWAQQATLGAPSTTRNTSGMVETRCCMPSTMPDGHFIFNDVPALGQ
jgi:hypothetical protein